MPNIYFDPPTFIEIKKRQVKETNSNKRSKTKEYNY